MSDVKTRQRRMDNIRTTIITDSVHNNDNYLEFNPKTNLFGITCEVCGTLVENYSDSGLRCKIHIDTE